MSINAPVTAYESGLCRTYLPKDIAEMVPSLVKSKDGWYETWWMDLPELSVHCMLDMDEVSLSVMKHLIEDRKKAIASKSLLEDGFSKMFSESKKPRPFQIQAMNFAKSQKRILLADDVGLGKTLISIGVFMKLFDDGEVDNLVVVCPSSVKYQWRREIVACNAAFPDLRISIVEGSKAEREKGYEDKAHVTILHYQSLLRDEVEITSVVSDRTMIVADECSGDGAVKNRTSKTSKAFKRAFKKSRYRMALTATPVENRLADLYSVMEWIDPMPFGTYKRFEEKYCRTVKLKIRRGWRTFTIPKIIGYKNLKNAQERIEHRYIRRTAKQVQADMPEVVSVIYRVGMSHEASVIYESIKGGLMKSEHLLGKIVPLRRCCSAPVLVGGTGEDSGKLDELDRLLDTELADESVLIVTQWRETWMDILRKRLKRFRPLMMDGETGNMDREVIKQTFQDGGSRMLVTTEIGERGLNLQTASVLVNLDMPWNPAKLWQRIGRLYRIGSEHETIRIVSLVAEDTIEERVLDVLSEKQDLFRALFETDGIEKISATVNSWGDRDIRRMM